MQRINSTVLPPLAGTTGTQAAVNSNGIASGSSTASTSVAQHPKAVGRHVALSGEAHRILSDIGKRMRNLKPQEQQELQSKISVLIAANTLLIDRDNGDAGSFGDQHLKELRDASNALKRASPLHAPATSKPAQGKHSAGFRAIDATLRQLSRHLGAELRATLREIERSEKDLQGDVRWSDEEAIALRIGISQWKAAKYPHAADKVPLAHESLEETTGEIMNLLGHAGARSLGASISVPRWDSGNYALVSSQHELLSQQLEKLAATVIQDSVPAETRKLVSKLQSYASHIARIWQLQIDLYEDYQSPDSLDNICHGKQCDIDAAIRVLKEDGEKKHANLIARLEDRWQALERLKLDPGGADARRLLGEKPISGFSRLLHPVDAARQALNLERFANTIQAQAGSGDRDAGKYLLELDGFSEPMLMRALLKKAGVADATRKHQAAQGRVLDNQPWDVIRSDIVVPVETANGIIVKTLESVATPASHVLADPARVAHADGNPVLSTANCKSYLGTDRQGKQVRGGFNSHDLAESTHALMAAHDELRMDGKLLFGATRHGVNAPVGLPADLQTMNPAQAQALITSLLGEPKIDPTVETISYPGKAAETPSAPSSGTKRDNLIRSEFTRRLQYLLDNADRLLDSLNEAGLSNDAKPANSAKLTADALLKHPANAEQLARMVRQDPELMQLLVRQGALNRAREVMIMEIARNPALGEKIADNEPLLFTSISLLTPDELRHFAASLIPGVEAFDEKSMLKLQVQAYQDLQKEIKAGALVINGKTIDATILPFNWGVNELSLLRPGNDPVIGPILNGHDYSNDLCNRESLQILVGLPDEDAASAKSNETEQFIARTEKLLEKLRGQTQTLQPGAEIKHLEDTLNVVRQLQTQIRDIWANESYRHPGNEPYKMPARIALLSHLIAGGTLFNCKSGKDRTGQLSVEAKFLALRIEANGGQPPTPDQPYTPVELVQYAALNFMDKTRTKMQQLATGYAGSKLSGTKQIFSNLFRVTDKLHGNEREALKRERLREFLGLSGRTKS